MTQTQTQETSYRCPACGRRVRLGIETRIGPPVKVVLTVSHERPRCETYSGQAARATYTLSPTEQRVVEVTFG